MMKTMLIVLLIATIVLAARSGPALLYDPHTGKSGKG
jgi:hypothetical protein